ncbi:hypothetical protein [Amycolatopsis anabasis]|uniref:hypothetical protein n=1 Tax=Amycolatopsis anabasis TaxID=1840409 RepID=UPI00131D4CAA|nr:hypothetical protein [Amycolatopsis anabasis]
MTNPALRARMPGRLVAVLVLVGVQAVLNAFYGVLVLQEISDRVEHGQDVDGLLPVLAYGSLFFAAAALVSAAAIALGRAWGRWPLLIFEALLCVNGVIALVMGALTAVAGLALAFLVISTLFHDTVQAWFDAKAYQRHQA